MNNSKKFDSLLATAMQIGAQAVALAEKIQSVIQDEVAKPPRPKETPHRVMTLEDRNTLIRLAIAPDGAMTCLCPARKEHGVVVEESIANYSKVEDL